MNVLDKYAEMSGLKVNYTKTSVIWIGSKKFSKEVFHHRLWKLDWGVTRFKMLGINFNVNLEDMIEENFKTKIEEIQNLMNIWSRRKLTVFGKITVLKTIIFAKLIHLLTSLPNPPEKRLDELNNSFYKFIWNYKVERIKRKVLIKNIEDGGVKMPNIKHFNKALKITWIKRLLLSDSKWTKMFEAETHTKAQHIVVFGDDYIKTLLPIENPFWRDCLIHWSEFLKLQNLSKTSKDSISTSLWYNSDIQIENKPIYYKQFEKNGIYYVNDLLDDDNQFYSLENIKKKINTNINFLSYVSLIRAVKEMLKTSSIRINSLKKCIGPIVSRSTYMLLNNSSACKMINELFCKNNVTPTSRKTFSTKGFHIDDSTWKQYYLIPFKCTLDSSLRWLQYRILHRILATNSFLFKINIIDSELCTFCGLERETLEHIFFECDLTRKFLSDISSWLLAKYGFHLTINWILLHC